MAGSHTYELAEQLYNRMTNAHNQPLDLEEMKNLVEKLPNSYRKPVQTIFANHIFTKQSFEIDKPTFCTVYVAKHQPATLADPPKVKNKVVRVVIHLKDIVDFSFSSDEETHQEPEPVKLSFSERLVMRINNSEGLKEGIEKKDLVTVRRAYSSYYSKYSP